MQEYCGHKLSSSVLLVAVSFYAILNGG